jgi:hypothetical protein
VYTVTFVVLPEIALVLELLVYGSTTGVGDFCTFLWGLGLILLVGVVSGVGLSAVLLVSQLLRKVQDTTKNNDKIACL